jgi:hypothetical protein
LKDPKSLLLTLLLARMAGSTAPPGKTRVWIVAQAVPSAVFGSVVFRNQSLAKFRSNNQEFSGRFASRRTNLSAQISDRQFDTRAPAPSPWRT